MFMTDPLRRRDGCVVVGTEFEKHRLLVELSIVVKDRDRDMAVDRIDRVEPHGVRLYLLSVWEHRAVSSSLR